MFLIMALISLCTIFFAIPGGAVSRVSAFVPTTGVRRGSVKFEDLRHTSTLASRRRWLPAPAPAPDTARAIAESRRGRGSLLLQADGTPLNHGVAKTTPPVAPVAPVALKRWSLGDVVQVEVPNLSSKFLPSRVPNLEITADTQGGATLYRKLIGDDEIVLYEHVRGPGRSPDIKAYLRAGPRASLHFKPKEVRAAVVTCGGLCPGLNSVIHHIVSTLLNIYDADKVFGIIGGFAGFWDENQPPVELTAKSVELIHHEGGSILGAARGGFDLEKIIDFIKTNQVNHLYIIGGDGTHRGAAKIAQECFLMGLNVAVAGIPKTIDNDVDIIDRSFGFLTAVEAAQGAIRSATTEAKCAVPNGIGVVKVMGRSAGFIAAFATLASGDVDLCLVPETKIILDGPSGCLPHVMKRVKDKGYAVIVVAEGAGEEILGSTGLTDATGHKVHPPIGPFMQVQIKQYFAEHGEVCNVKYIDPSYMIRSIPANSYDQVYCMQLAQNAVHGAMAGYTAFSVGMVNDRTVYLPMEELVANSPRAINPVGRTWENVLTVTRQPSTDDHRTAAS